MSERRILLTVDHNRGPHTILQFADLGHEGFAMADNFGWSKGCINDTDAS